MIPEHATEWLGFPVKSFDEKLAEKGISDYTNTIYRIALDWDSDADFEGMFHRFLSNPASAETPAIIIGRSFGDDPTQGNQNVVQLLASARQKLPKLRGIFLGDMISEECEISWIVQSKVSPLLQAYPDLEHLRIRGVGELSFGVGPAHARLKSLTIESGGLPSTLFAEIMGGHLPALESLELWLGTPDYEGDVTVAALQPLLSGELFPALKHLGLRNSEIADEIAVALLEAPVLSRLNSLDLSLGTLGDRGGKALLSNSRLKRLKQLDVHRHFLSKQVMAELKREFPTIDLGDAQGDSDAEDRYVAVGE